MVREKPFLIFYYSHILEKFSQGTFSKITAYSLFGALFWSIFSRSEEILFPSKGESLLSISCNCRAGFPTWPHLRSSRCWFIFSLFIPYIEESGEQVQCRLCITEPASGGRRGEAIPPPPGHTLTSTGCRPPPPQSVATAGRNPLNE